jgi:hypothetical protein
VKGGSEGGGERERERKRGGGGGAERERERTKERVRESERDRERECVCERARFRERSRERASAGASVERFDEERYSIMGRPGRHPRTRRPAHHSYICCVVTDGTCYRAIHVCSVLYSLSLYQCRIV